MDGIARHFRTGRWIRVRVEGPTIASVGPAAGPEELGPEDDWIAPAFWDIQSNGRFGVSFADPTLTIEQVVEIVRAQAELGTARMCPTLFTAGAAATMHGIRTIAAACERDAVVGRMVVGLHLEGPYICPLDGYRGAHPLEAVRNPDWEEFRAWQAASGGRIRLMTLAPERPGALDFIRRAVASGVVIALGHTAADPATIHAAADAGATLSTHLGNGIAAQLARHPNPIFAQAADDRLMASLIADGHHLDGDTLRVLVRAKGLERIILVSDASPLAGLPPGVHGEWAVDPSGKIVVAGTPYLAGSNQSLETGLRTLMEASGAGLAEAIGTVTSHPARLLGMEPARIEAGGAADLVVVRRSGDAFSIVGTYVGGGWVPGVGDATGTAP